MEIIQEIIGTRKKQQILNQEAKKTLHKQIKKVTHREVSEPPPTNKAIISNPHQLLQQQLQQKAPDSKVRDESVGSAYQQPHQLQQVHQQSSSKRSERVNRDYPGQQDGHHHVNNSSQAHHHQQQPDQSAKSSVKQMASPKLASSSKKQSQQNAHQQASSNQQQNASHQSSNSKKHQLHQQQQQIQDARIRKVRSKSPPTNESGKNPAAKIKKFYDGMIPSFTNKKRQHAYYNTAKQGFTYINWDMENELYIFQTQIEQKFRKSTMNKNFAFPRIETTTRNDVKTRGSFDKNNNSQQHSQHHLAQSASQAQNKQLLNVGRQVKALSPDQVQRKSSRGAKAVPQTDKAQSVDKQVGVIEADGGNNGHGIQMNKQVPRLFNAAAISQSQNLTTGELSARAAATGGKGSSSMGPHANSDQKTKHTSSSNYHNKSSSKNTTPGNNNANISSFKVVAASQSHPMSKSVLKPSDKHQESTITPGGAPSSNHNNYNSNLSQQHEHNHQNLISGNNAVSQSQQLQLQQQHHSSKKKDKSSQGQNNHTLNVVSQTSSSNSLKLNNQNAKQLQAMVKQGTSNPPTGSGSIGQQHQSTLFSPNQSAVSRKNQKQMVQTTYVSVKGSAGAMVSQSTSQKTYGLAGSAANAHHGHQSQTMPNTPLPNSNPSQTSASQFATAHIQPPHSRDQSVKSQRDVQQLQQGQSEPLFKKATTYMSRKNGQQHSVNARMPKASPAYCTTQFNNSVNSSQMLLKQTSNASGGGNTTTVNVNANNNSHQHQSDGKFQQVSSRLGAQNSLDPSKDLSSNQTSGKKQQQAVCDLSGMSQFTATQRLNESATALHSSTNVIKFSSEYGTYNTVHLGEDMDNRSSDYVNGGAESTGRQSQKTNPMQLSGIVSPDIQIQSIEQESSAMGFEPLSLVGSSANTTKAGNKLLMQMPYGGQVIENSSIQATKMARSGQNSVQAMRNSGAGQQNSQRLSPATKKRNIRGQMSSQMNKTTSTNEAKKQLQKNSNNFTQSSNMNKTSKNFYKTMIKPGAISSQSFIHAPDATNTIKTVHTKHTMNRFNSQTPRNVTSPEHHHNAIQNHNKLQKTSDQKQEHNHLGGGRGTSGLVHQTPSSKIKGSNSKVHRGASLNSKEMALVSKFKTDSHSGPMFTPGQLKMAPSKAFKGSDSKQIKDFSPNAGQKNVRSRNNETGKQTADNVQMSAKWIDEKQQALTLKKVTDSKSTMQGGNLSKRADKKSSQGPSKRQTQQYNRHDTEECENFSMKDLDEREPCQQSFPTHEFHSVGRDGQKMMKVPLTTRSTHSLALNNHLKKQMTQDLNMTSPAQLEESVNSGAPGHNNSSQHLSYGRQQTQQTQPQVKYRNEIKLQGGPINHPHQVSSFHNMNPEYLSGDGSSHMDGGAPIISGGGDSVTHKHSNPNLLNNTIGQHQATGNGSASASDLGVVTTVTSVGGKMHNQVTTTMKDFFMCEEPGYEVIKEEKHQKSKNSKGQSQQAIGAGASSSSNMKNSRTKSGQLNLMARDFTMQNYQVMKNGQSTKVLNLPPKPSRNAKNNTLVLGSSTGAPTRSMQSITLSKVKNFNQQQTMQQTMVMTPKREQFTSNNLFKGFQQTRGKNDNSSKHQTQPSSNQANVQQQNPTFKTASYKEPKIHNQNSQMRYSLNKTVEKKDQHAGSNNNQNNNGSNRYSVQDRSSPRVAKQRLESAKKVSKVASQENLKTIGNSASHQYSLSLIANNQQKMPTTPHLNSIHSTAEKKGAKHLYMSLNKETKTANSKGSNREKSVSTERYQSNQKQGGGHYHSLTSGKSREKQSMPQKQRGTSNGAQNKNDYEIVFDHLHEDSIPDNPSYDMDEQPTVVLIDDFNQQTNGGTSKKNQQMGKHHKSKERNASLLNSSALSREQQISHPFTKSIDPMTMPPANGRNTVKEMKNTLNSDQLPKLGSTDSKLFRQSIGHMQTTPSVGLSGGVATSGPHLSSNHKASSSQQSTGVMKDMHSFNKQLSKKTSALKLKTGQSSATAAQSQQQMMASGASGAQYHTTQPSIASYIAAQQQVSQNMSGQHQPLSLNKTSSMVSSQASLHAGMGSGLTSVGSKNMHAQQQQKLIKQTSSASGMSGLGNGPTPGTMHHQQKMMETYTKALQGQSTAAGGSGSAGQSTTQSLVAAKKTTKKSMIKQ